MEEIHGFGFAVPAGWEWGKPVQERIDQHEQHGSYLCCTMTYIASLYQQLPS